MAHAIPEATVVAAPAGRSARAARSTPAGHARRCAGDAGYFRAAGRSADDAVLARHLAGHGAGSRTVRPVACAENLAVRHEHATARAGFTLRPRHHDVR